MKQIAINPTAFNVGGMTYTHETGASTAWFSVPNSNANLPPSNVGVRVDGTNLLFFPERSAGQRQILKLLGADS